MITRRLTVDDISMILEMNTSFREGLVDKEGILNFLSYDKNYLVGTTLQNKINRVNFILQTICTSPNVIRNKVMIATILCRG